MKRLLFIVVQFAAVVLYANNTSIFSNYSTAQGLVHKTVNCIVRDKDGFLWIGTTNGLSRFDGYGFKNYIHNEDDTLSLLGTSVWGLVEGKDGRIWITTDAGLEYFDKPTEQFHRVNFKDNKGMNSLKHVCVDERGFVWTYNASTQFKVINPHNNVLSSYTFNTIADTLLTKNLTVYHFAVLNNIVWFASNKGILKFDYQKNTLTYLYKSNLSFCFSIRQTNENTLLLTCMYDGVYVLNTKSEKGFWVEKNFLTKGINTQTVLCDATFSADSTLWVVAAPGLFSVKNNKVTYFNNYSANSYFEGDVATCIYTDKENTLWIGTNANGIFYKQNKKQIFQTKNQLFSGEPYNTSVMGFKVFDNRSLLYCNSKGFYYCKDFTQLTPNCAQKIANASTSSIHSIDGNRCFANNVDTLFTFDSRNKQLLRALVAPSTQCAVKDKNGVLWLGAWHGVLSGYDETNAKRYTIVVDSLNRKVIAIYTMLVDDDGSLWLGTFGAGLVHVINPTAPKPILERYVHRQGKNSISLNVIISLFNDHRGNIWIGTCGGGLNRFSLKTRQFEVFSLKNGLKSNVIEAITSDDFGNIWFTSSVLSRYDVQKKTFTHFSQSDGIEGSFVVGACAKAADGQLLFGTTKGLLIFDPKLIKENAQAVAPLLTDFRIRGLSVKTGDTIDNCVPYSQSITYAKSISLPYSIHSFAIEFASIQFHDSQSLLYEYMLEGVDRKWIPSDSRNRLASYSGLQPGKYVFKVRASNGTEAWSEARQLVVEIVPPWWQTWWCRIGVTLILSISITGFVFYRFRSFKKRNVLLEQKVLERTNALSVVNVQLHRQNEQLKENQIVIEMRNADLNEAVQVKDELMKMIGHDFKNPLKSIISMSEVMTTDAGANPEKSKRFAETILSSAQLLNDQMTTMLSWAQNVHNIVAKPIEINLEVLLDDAISLVKEQAQQKKISIGKQLDFTSNACIDPRMISIVFRNLLSNAIKFSNREASILVLAQEFDTSIDVVFVDTGVGMTHEVLATVFSQATNSGVELQLCKSFVEINGGQIKATSQENDGSVFTVTLPKGQTLIGAKQSLVDDTAALETNKVASNEPISILIIDDNVEILNIVQLLFTDNYSVVKAEDGNEGLYIAQNLLPDIIICDIHLPSKNGIDVCRILKSNELTSHIPILLITSHRGADFESKSYASGANDYIEKPFNPYALKQKVVALLDYRRQIREQIQKSIDQDKQAALPLDYDNKIIRKVLEFIEQNISDSELDTETVANKVSISRSQLWRIFKHTTGKSLGDYIREIRMKKAVEMLKTGRYRIAEVGYEVGYSDAKNFSRNFVKEFGMTPSQFADLQKK